MGFSGSGRPLEIRVSPGPGAHGDGKILLRVKACGVCRTDLHVVDVDLSEPKPDVVPGHEIVATVEVVGAGVVGFAIGDRVGVPWLGWTCGACRFCLSGQENLCDRAGFTGTRWTAGTRNMWA